jgi:cytochrome c oxidase cbb3-type subunit 1
MRGATIQPGAFRSSGWNAGKEYAELEWAVRTRDRRAPRVAFAVVFCGTIAKSARIVAIYISNWFLRCADHRLAMLHVVNTSRCPRLSQAYSLYRARRAVRAVLVRPQRRRLPAPGGFLADALLLSAEAGRGSRIWSYTALDRRVLGDSSTLHLAGPHHLHYNAIPEWVQSLASS